MNISTENLTSIMWCKDMKKDDELKNDKITDKTLKRVPKPHTDRPLQNMKC